MDKNQGSKMAVWRRADAQPGNGWHPQVEKSAASPMAAILRRQASQVRRSLTSMSGTNGGFAQWILLLILVTGNPVHAEVDASGRTSLASADKVPVQHQHGHSDRLPPSNRTLNGTSDTAPAVLPPIALSIGAYLVHGLVLTVLAMLLLAVLGRRNGHVAQGRL